MADSAPTLKSSHPVVPPAIEQYFQVCLLLLLGMGFLTLVVTGKLDPLSSVCMSVALLLRAYLMGRGTTVQIPEKVTSYLGLIYVLVYILDFFFLSDNFVIATVHLLLFGIIVKMFSIHRDRDYAYLTMLAFLEVLSAAILTVDSVFLGALGIFLLIGVVTFIALEMRRSSLRGGPVQRISTIALLQRKRLRIFSYAVSTMGIALVASILLASVGIFFVMPRMSTGGYLSKLAQQNELVSGFSDNVSLGEIGRIQQSSQIVAHVRIGEGEKGAGVLLRGNTLSEFDGRNWLNPPHETSNLASMGGSFDLRANSHLRLAVSRKAQTIKYRVILEPIGTNIVFTIPSPILVLGPFRELSMDHAQVVINTDQDHPTSLYSGTSDLSQPTLQEFEASSGPYPDEVRDRYLQLPDDLDPRIPELAREITKHSRTTIEKAAAIQAYLSKFTYTLQLPSQRQKDPIAYFLFERKAGHCEYFASSMAVLLREVGIPTRVVTGFRGGEWNDLTGNFIIRAKDAHSWVEVYFPGLGWYSFDPTPAGGAPIVSTWSRMQLYLDAAQEFWREWVVNYDYSHQQHLTNVAVNKSVRLFERVKQWSRREYAAMVRRARETHKLLVNSPRAYVVTVVLFISGIILLFNVPRVARAIMMHNLASNPGKEPQGAASIWYRKMTNAMARRGHRKLPSQTPEEFVGKIDDAELRDGVARFTQHYERARFGNSAKDAVELPKIYEEIVQK
jgi:transglutaminase-like putative cysteine protease